jgi:hypothetical protein
MRPADSSYDRLFASATAALLAACRAAGYAVSTPTTGAVLLTRAGRTLTIPPDAWDRLCAWPLADALDALADAFRGPLAPVGAAGDT